MKKHLLILSTFLLSFSAYSQIIFERGYFIDNEGDKKNCLIKNEEWIYNPTEFQYKLSENSEIITSNTDDVNAFGIENEFVYIKRQVAIDRSTSNVSNMSYEKKPDLKTETLFLKRLIQGKANLYGYRDANLVRFFYDIDENETQQLIYKRYKTIDNISIKKNNGYRNQLWLDLKCAKINENKIKNLEYKKQDLIKFFIAYNECQNAPYLNYGIKQKKDLFNLSIKPGISFSNVSFQSNIFPFENPELNNELTFRIGFEAELILPLNKNKISIIFEPSYEYYKTSGVLMTQFTSNTIDVDYKSIEVPVGIRYYLFLNEDSKIFINSSMLWSAATNSNFSLNNNTITLPIKTRFNVSFGLGYKYGDKYSIELRNYTKRKLLLNDLSRISNIERTSLVFGYTLF